MVVGATGTGIDMVVAYTARACCSVAVSRGAFGRDGASCRIVAFSGDAVVGSFT